MCTINDHYWRDFLIKILLYCHNICELSVQFSFEQLCHTFQINRLNTKCDQYQTSPSDINALQNRLVMGIKDMITQDTMSWYFNNFSLLGNVQGQQIGIWILISWPKGLKPHKAFSLTWSASMLIYWNKRKFLHKKRVQLPQDWFGTPTWPPFHCFGTL